MFIEDVKEILGHLKGIVNTSVFNLMLLFGFLLVLGSFVGFDGLEHFSFTAQPKLTMLIIGSILLIGSPTLYVYTKPSRQTIKKLTTTEGMRFSFNQTIINVKVGKIQEVSGLNKDAAVVLPANTSFIDDCIADGKSALGAFFLKFFPEKIPKVREDIEQQLLKQGHQKNEDASYPPGTTIILPEEYNTPAKCIITASTIRREKVGILISPNTICECVRQVFEITADKKIEKLYMPVLGSGHGGLDINDALLFLVLSLKYYSKIFHHIKTVDIMVMEDNVKNLKDIQRLSI